MAAVLAGDVLRLHLIHPERSIRLFWPSAALICIDTFESVNWALQWADPWGERIWGEPSDADESAVLVSMRKKDGGVVMRIAEATPTLYGCAIKWSRARSWAQKCPECRTVNPDGLGSCEACGASLRRKSRPDLPVHRTWEFALVIGLIVVGILYLPANRG